MNRFDPNTQRPGESDYAFARRQAAFGRSVSITTEETQALRATITRAASTAGSGTGIFGGINPSEVLDHPHDSGAQRVARNGGADSGICVPGSVAIGRVFASQLDQSAPKVAHLKTTGSSGEGWS